MKHDPIAGIFDGNRVYDGNPDKIPADSYNFHMQKHIL